ncbi:lanthionine synthetase LanC family protein [Flavobacteriaceae bacterium M23B6Z8]
MKKEILQIESVLYDIATNMNMPTIAEDLGVVVFESTLYRYSKNEVYKQKTLELLEKAIEVFPERKMHTGFLEGFESFFWVVDYLFKHDIVSDDSFIDDLKPHLFKSIEIDLQGNFFDALHGSINKLDLLFNSEKYKQEEVLNYIDLFIDSLLENKVENEKGIYWYDSSMTEKNIVNLGLAHGISGILVFLTKIKNQGYENPKMDYLIEGIIKSLVSFKNKNPYNCYFPSNYSENGSEAGSRLAWCNGDLGIAYAMLYSAETLKKTDLRKEAIEVINGLYHRRISNSEIDHFEENFFFDTAFCHGLSGITYTLAKINELLKNPLIDKRIDYWKGELLHNLNTQLNIKGDIYYPAYKQDKDHSYVLDTCSMLAGLTGTGLVLLSLEYGKYDWSDFFLLY